MLIIEKEQMSAFNESARQFMIERISSHMQEYFSEQCSIMGEKSLGETVKLGVNKSWDHGFIPEREVFLFVSIMFMLGSGFDTDFQCPWAQEILGNNDEKKDEQINTLYEAAMEHLNTLIGVRDDEHVKVLMRIRDKNIDETVEEVQNDLAEGIRNFCVEIHPRKAKLIGEHGIDRLVKQATETALKYDITHDKGTVIILAHMFLLGCSFDTDPQFPWVIETLHHETPEDESDKYNLLYNGAIEHLNKSLKF
jgi:hypothetical protein